MPPKLDKEAQKRLQLASSFDRGDRVRVLNEHVTTRAFDATHQARVRPGMMGVVTGFFGNSTCMVHFENDKGWLDGIWGYVPERSLELTPPEGDLLLDFSRMVFRLFGIEPRR